MFNSATKRIMFSHEQALQKKLFSQPVVSCSSSTSHASKYKHMLTLAIYDLSIQIQQTGHITTSSNDIGLKIEHEAVNYIESLILDVFMSILFNYSSSSSQHNIQTPEIAFTEAMSMPIHVSSSSSTISTSATISSLNSVDSNTTSILSTGSYKSFASSSNDSHVSTTLVSIVDLAEAKSKVEQVLPHSYAETACSKAQSIVDKCRLFMNSNKRINKLLKTFGESQQNGSSVGIRSTSSNELNQLIKFPLDKIHAILVKESMNKKFDVFISIFLVSVLEFITKDILRLATVYVRYLQTLGKHSINQVDVKTAIQADRALTRIFYSKDYTSDDSIFEMKDDYDDEDDVISNEIFEQRKETAIGFEHPNKSKKQTSYENNSTPSQQTANSNEECVSDSSTICAESVSIEKLNMKYSTKVKELLLEQNQHLNDLNILRRIFMYLFRKCCIDFEIKLQNKNEQEHDEIIEVIFGNINDLYDCALRLADLLDENVLNSKQTPNNNRTQQQQPLNYVGQYFWELAEGAAFSVYNDYALTVTNVIRVTLCIKMVLIDPNVKKFLQTISPGLAEISKYLLPRLLVGSIYHFLYMYETIEYLQQISTDELDKTLLSDTLDTMKSTKYRLKEQGYVDSRRRPIETSFRMFQPHQLQQLNSSDTFNPFSDSVSANINSSSIQNLSHSSAGSSYSAVTQALISNIIFLTRYKWTEIEKNVESFKLPTGKNQSSVIQIPSNSNNSSLNSGLNGSLSISTSSYNSMASLNESNIKNAYLYEGYVLICKSTQSGGSLVKTSGQPKYKLSKRYAYLFDGMLILVKRQLNNLLTSSSYKYTSRFKQALSLDKCNLKDYDEEMCFELEVFNSQSRPTNSNNNNQSQEFILFKLDSSKEKYQWMSMLCYSQYKSTIDRLLQTMTEEQNNKNPLPIPPENYIFDQPDSADVILFEQQQIQPNQNAYVHSDGPSIRAATLIKLIERLTHHYLLYPKFSNTFLMCYRDFCTSHDLFKLLTQRYELPDLTELRADLLNKYSSDGFIEREIFKRYKREYQQPVRLKVVNFMKHWINGYFSDDFANDQSLLKQLDEFIEKVGQTNQRLQQLLLNALNHQKLKKKTTLSSSNIDLASESLSSSSTNDLNNKLNETEDIIANNSNEEEEQFPPFEAHLETKGIYDILCIHPLEFARQATLMEFELFKEIRPSELISLGWNKPERHTLSPNLTKLINLSNKFTYWYAKCIVETLNLDERVIVMQRILEIAKYFYEMNNFSGLKQIYAAFEASSVIRLEVSREKSAIEHNEMYAKFKKLFENHDKKYLENLKKCNPPCVPFLGSHLTLILKKQEHNKLLKEQSNLINFSKYRLLVGFVTDLLQYQNISYRFRIHPQIRSFILKDIEDTFALAEAFYFSDLKANPPPIAVSESTLASLTSGGTNDPSRMVEEWLFIKSKQIESTKEAIDFPKTRSYAFQKCPPPLSKLNNKNINSLTFKLTSKHSLNTSATFSSDINNNTSTNSGSGKSPLLPRFELRKNKSLQPQTSNNNNNNDNNSSQKSINLLTAPFVLTNLSQQQQPHTILTDFKKLTENSNYAESSGRITTSSAGNGNHSSIGSFIRSSSSFQKQSRSSHKRSNSSVQVSKEASNSRNNKVTEQANLKTREPAPNFSQIASINTNKPNALNVSSTSIGVSSTSSLTSSSASALSSIMFSASNHSGSSTNIPHGSYYAVSSSSSSPSPPVSILATNHHLANQSATNQETIDSNTKNNKPTLSSSSMNSALAALVYGSSSMGSHSLSSADSSSSAPNSPPPNYDEVFDSSSLNNVAFNFNSTLNSISNAATGTSSSLTLSTSNCFDNKTYFERLYSSSQPSSHSSSLSNLKYLEVNSSSSSSKISHTESSQKKASAVDQLGINSVLLLSPTSLSESSSSSYSSSNLNFPSQAEQNSALNCKSKQLSVFSFLEFTEQNEEIEILKKNTPNSQTSSIDILTPPPFMSMKLAKNQALNSILTPPPSKPLPPTDSLTFKNSIANLTPAVSQTSINSMPPPPNYAPPVPQIVLGCLPDTPPPIPARPKKKLV